MLRVIWNGMSAMNAEQQKLDSISNNIANVNTIGYKREDVSFQDLVYENLKRTGYPTNSNNQNEIQNGTGVKAGEWIKDNSQGNLKQTGAKTDLAIDGEGYFRVTLADGTKGYERAGSFNIDSNGSMVDKNGNKLDIDLTEDGSNLSNAGVMLTADNFTVKQNGEIYVNDNSSSVLYGKINTYNAIGDNSLKPIGENLYIPNQGAQMNINSNSNILQGFVEESNVDVAKEMTDMIIAQRAFQLGSTALKTGDEMWGLINNMRGR